MRSPATASGRRALRTLAAAGLLLLAGLVPAHGQSVLAAARARGAVHCGAVTRPALAQQTASGAWAGVLADVCRAIAVAALGPPGSFEFHAYALDADFGRVGAGKDDVTFLTGAEINAHGLAGVLVPGPNVFIAGNAVMVPASARERHLGELSGAGICYLIGASAERSLESWFEQNAMGWLRHAYSEEGEMVDAYAAQRCHAIAGEATWLARQRERAGNRDRLLPEALEVFPLIAATGTADGRWSAIVGWTVTTLVNGARPESKWYAGGARAMPLAAPELGLVAGWQEKVLAATGSYDAIYARHVGPDSLAPLQSRSRAGAVAGGLLLAPYVE